MTTHLQPFFNAQSQLLAEGRISSLVRAYGVPLPVFLLDTTAWHLLRSRGALVEAFFAKHRAIRAAGVGRLRACVTREHWITRERCQAQVTWFYIGAGGRRVGRTVANYYLSRGPDGVKVDMLEFRRIAFPQLHDWFAGNAVRVPPGHIL